VPQYEQSPDSKSNYPSYSNGRDVYDWGSRKRNEVKIKATQNLPNHVRPGRGLDDLSAPTVEYGFMPIKDEPNLFNKEYYTPRPFRPFQKNPPPRKSKPLIEDDLPPYGPPYHDRDVISNHVQAINSYESGDDNLYRKAAPPPKHYDAPVPSVYPPQDPYTSRDQYGKHLKPHINPPSQRPTEESYGAPEPPQLSYGAPEPPQLSYGAREPTPRPQLSYGAPEPTPRPQQTYGAPEPTIRPQQSYGAPEPSPRPQQSYGAPEPTPRAQQAYRAPQPSARPILQSYMPEPVRESYGAPNTSPRPTQPSYRAPEPSSIPHQSYGTPEPVEDIDTYGAPIARPTGPSFRPESYGAPEPSLRPQQSYGSPEPSPRPQQSYGTPEPSPSPQQSYEALEPVQDSYGAPKATPTYVPEFYGVLEPVKDSYEAQKAKPTYRPESYGAPVPYYSPPAPPQDTYGSPSQDPYAPPPYRDSPEEYKAQKVHHSYNDLGPEDLKGKIIQHAKAHQFKYDLPKITPTPGTSGYQQFIIHGVDTKYDIPKGNGKYQKEPIGYSFSFQEDTHHDGSYGAPEPTPIAYSPDPHDSYGAPPQESYVPPPPPPTQESYGAPKPTARPQQSYGAPEPSPRPHQSSYGTPEPSPRPHQSYGAPEPSPRPHQSSYGTPEPSPRPQQSYGAQEPSPRPQQSYGAPEPSARPHQSSYGTPEPSPRPHQSSYGTPEPSPRPQQSYGAPEPSPRPHQSSYGTPEPSPRPHQSYGSPEPSPRPQQSYDAPQPSSPRPHGHHHDETQSQASRTLPHLNLKPRGGNGNENNNHLFRPIFSTTTTIAPHNFIQDVYDHTHPTTPDPISRPTIDYEPPESNSVYYDPRQQYRHQSENSQIHHHQELHHDAPRKLLHNLGDLAFTGPIYRETANRQKDSEPIIKSHTTFKPLQSHGAVGLVNHDHHHDRIPVDHANQFQVNNLHFQRGSEAKRAKNYFLRTTTLPPLVISALPKLIGNQIIYGTTRSPKNYYNGGRTHTTPRPFLSSTSPGSYLVNPSTTVSTLRPVVTTTRAPQITVTTVIPENLHITVSSNGHDHGHQVDLSQVINHLFPLPPLPTYSHTDNLYPASLSPRPSRPTRIKVPIKRKRPLNNYFASTTTAPFFQESLSQIPYPTQAAPEPEPTRPFFDRPQTFNIQQPDFSVLNDIRGFVENNLNSRGPSDDFLKPHLIKDLPRCRTCVKGLKLPVKPPRRLPHPPSSPFVRHEATIDDLPRRPDTHDLPLQIPVNNHLRPRLIRPFRSTKTTAKDSEHGSSTNHNAQVKKKRQLSPSDKTIPLARPYTYQLGNHDANANLIRGAAVRQTNRNILDEFYSPFLSQEVEASPRQYYQDWHPDQTNSQSYPVLHSVSPEDYNYEELNIIHSAQEYSFDKV
jgi:hypothetical protein